MNPLNNAEALRLVLSRWLCPPDCFGGFNCGFDLGVLPPEVRGALEAMWLSSNPHHGGSARHASVAQLVSILKTWLAVLERDK